MTGPVSTYLVSSGASSLQCTWSAPSQIDGVPLGYLLTPTGGTTNPVPVYVPAQQTSVWLTGLEPGTVYLVSIELWTTQGPGSSVGASNATTAGADNLSNGAFWNPSFQVGPIWIAGQSLAKVDLKAFLSQGGGQYTMEVTQNWARQGDTAQFYLYDQHADGVLSFAVQNLASVTLIDTTINKTIFGGLCSDPKFMWVSPNDTVWNLSCQDWTLYADTAPVHGEYSNQTVDAIILDMVTQANCGLTAESVSNGGYIYPGPTIPYYRASYVSLSDGLKQLMNYAAQQSEVGWWVDENLAVHFSNMSQAPLTGILFTNVETDGEMSPSLSYYKLSNQFYYEMDGTQVYTGATIRGINLSLDQDMLLFGNGSTAAWPVTYAVNESAGSAAHGVGTVHVGAIWKVNKKTGIGKWTGGVLYEIQLTPGSPWYFEQNLDLSWTLHASSPPGPGIACNVQYRAWNPIVAQYQNYALANAIGGANNGLFYKMKTDSSLPSYSAAYSVAQSYVATYGVAQERPFFETVEGWTGHIRAGEQFSFKNSLVPDSQNNYLPGLISQFLAVQVTMRIQNSVYRTYQVQGVRISG